MQYDSGDNQIGGDRAVEVKFIPTPSPMDIDILFSIGQGDNQFGGDRAVEVNLILPPMDTVIILLIVIGKGDN